MFDFYLPRIGPDGKYRTDDRYREILRLYDMLSADGIPCVLQKRLDGWHLEYPCCFTTNGDRVCSVVENFGSYGSEQDLLEIMGLLTAEEEENDSVLGWLTADDVYLRIVSHYQKTQEAARVEKEEQ
jgi:hypothetical protein